MRRSLARGIAGPAMFALLTFQAAAQLPHEARSVHAWPEVVTVGSMLPALARTCSFDAATGREVVVLRVHEVGVGAAARDLFVLRDVARSHACVSLGSAIDFVVVDCGPHAQGVIALGGDGTLQLVRWAAGQAVPAVQTLAAWPGFRRLAAVRNGGTTELLGFDTASVRIRRATWSGTELSPSTLVFAPPGVNFIEGIDWNHDGQLELLVGTPTTMFVQGWNMAPITNIALPAAAQPGVTVATCVSHASGAGDQLVMVVSQGGQTAVTWANSTMSGGLLLGPHEISCVATFDREGDGDEDVLLGDAHHSVVHVLLREPSGFVPAVAPLIVGPTAPDAGIRALAGGDIDGDADGDVVAFHIDTMKVQTWFDAARSAQRLRGLHADLRELVLAPTVQLPVTVQLPHDLSALHPAASFRLSFDGWLVDPAVGTVMPQRALQHEIAIDPGACEHTVTLSLALPPACLAGFHLQLVARVVAVPQSGASHRLPPTLLHVTTRPELEPAILRTVAEELTGNPDAKIGGDGGGDGNILGTKTGKHQIGVPPE